MEAANPRDLSGDEPRKERDRATRMSGPDHPAERDPQVREEPQQHGKAHQDAARAVVPRARLVNRPAARGLLLPERGRVETLVAVRDDDGRVVPERAAALEHAEREGGVLAG